MTSPTPTLTACPFCGATPQLIAREDGPLLRGAYVICDECKTSNGIYTLASEAVAAWNRRAALSLPAGEPAWQPIETAPKDGTHIQLFRPEIQFVGYFAVKAGVWCINAPGLPVMDPAPTQWQPLPSVPSATPSTPPTAPERGHVLAALDRLEGSDDDLAMVYRAIVRADGEARITMDDIYTLIGTAEGMRAMGQQDMPRWLADFTMRLADALGLPEAVIRAKAYADMIAVDAKDPTLVVALSAAPDGEARDAARLSVDAAMKVLLAALDSAAIHGEARINAIGYFCNHWNAAMAGGSK